jgi:hypothetical protein
MPADLVQRFLDRATDMASTVERIARGETFRPRSRATSAR